MPIYAGAQEVRRGRSIGYIEQKLYMVVSCHEDAGDPNPGPLKSIQYTSLLGHCSSPS